MVTLRHLKPTLLTQYLMLGLFALEGLLSIPRYSPEWWLFAGLALAYGVWIFLWPVRQPLIYLYLAVEIILLFSLTLLDQQFMLMGFILSVHAFLLLPLRFAVYLMAAYSLAFEALLIYRFGWREGLYPGLIPAIGYMSFGFAYYQRQRAMDADEESQRVLAELREVNQKLEAYAAQVQELATVEERNRLARELHDSVKQQAFAASGQLGAARALLRTDPAASEEHLRQAEQLMDEVRSELSQLIHELRPVALQDHGLASALRQWGEGWSQACGVKLEIRVQNERSLPLETEQALFRIAQEALSNIARHSRASSAEVCLDYGPGTVRLEVCDNGQGFDSAQPFPGMGLRSMRERVERLKEGKIEINSGPREGTRIIIHCAA